MDRQGNAEDFASINVDQFLTQAVRSMTVSSCHYQFEPSRSNLRAIHALSKGDIAISFKHAAGRERGREHLDIRAVARANTLDNVELNVPTTHRVRTTSATVAAVNRPFHVVDALMNSGVIGLKVEAELEEDFVNKRRRGLISIKQECMVGAARQPAHI